VDSNWTLQRIARIVLIVGAVVVGVWMLRRFLPALAWAGVLAIATWPLRERLARKGASPTALASLLTLAVAVVLVVPLLVLGVQAARESVVIVELMRELRQNGLGTPDWVAHLPFVGAYAAAWWQQNLADPEAARELFGRAESSGLIVWTRFLGLELFSRLIVLVLTLLALFFLYRDGPELADQSHAISAHLLGPPGKRLGKDLVAAVRGTVNGLVLVGLGEGVLLGAAYFATGLSHPVLLGLATGALATVPFGAPLIYVTCSLILFAQSSTASAIALLVFGSVVVFIADHFVRPILIGSSTRLPFLWVLLGIFGGLETFGLIGLFLGPAVMSVLIAMWREAADLKES
jgi:predicted PurR-regulated permease PerM